MIERFNVWRPVASREILGNAVILYVDLAARELDTLGQLSGIPQGHVSFDDHRGLLHDELHDARLKSQSMHLLPEAV